MIARTTGQQPVRLSRSPDEVTFLAFDASIKRLVELHVLGKGRPLDTGIRQTVLRRAREVALFRGPSFTRILDVGEDHGLAYYTSNLNDGEFAGDYVRRIGPPPPALVFALVHQLLEDLVRLKEQLQVVPSLRLDRVLVTTHEDAFLQLRLYDLALTARETPEEGAARLVIEGCRLIFQLLTGKEHQGESPDLFPALTAVPMSLRTTMRGALSAGGVHAPVSLEKLKDDVREAHSALVSSIQARTSRKQLLVTPAFQPKSQIQEVLLESVPVETILGGRFEVVVDENFRRQPFSIPCVNAKSGQPVTVHLLPPSRIVDKSLYEAVPLQMWRFDPEKHPNILRSLSLWESPDWTFLTEEREPGFSLSRLLAERVCLNPAEVLVLLRQVHDGQEQAIECGVERLDLHPSGIFLRVGKNGHTQARECERLMQKRVDVWPPFVAKLRAHLTLRNLYEPPLVDKPEQGEHPETHLADRDYRHRVFVGLAVYLLTGERQTGGQPLFPETVPESLSSYLCECLEKSRQHGATPSPAEFLQRFEELMNGPAVPDLLTRMRGAMVNIEEMESAGSVSDFEDDFDSSSHDDDSQTGTIPAKLKPVAYTSRRSSRRRNSFPFIELAAGLTVAALIVWFVLPRGKSGPAQTKADLVQQPHNPAKEVPAAKADPRQTATLDLPAPATVSAPNSEPYQAAPVKDTPKQSTAKTESGPQKTEAKLPKAPAMDEPPPPAAEVAAVMRQQPDAPTPPGEPPSPAPASDSEPEKTAPPATQEPALTVQAATAPPPAREKPVITQTPPPQASPEPSADAPPEAKPPAGPRIAKPVPNPVIIRKALVPTPEEIAKFKQGLNAPKPPQNPAPPSQPQDEGEEQKTGTLPPAPNLARP